ncbi:unnamed protein product, partial [Amoebophrya sp. A120]|eukprot:GSA120T00026241001.1
MKDRWQSGEEVTEEEELPALESNVNVDPEEFGGRKNWLSSLETMCTMEGKDAVSFPHLELQGNATYILQIELDSSRCVERTEVPVNNAEIVASEANGEEPAEEEEGAA